MRHADAYVIVEGAGGFIDFLVSAFGAEEIQTLAEEVSEDEVARRMADERRLDAMWVSSETLVVEG